MINKRQPLVAGKTVLYFSLFSWSIQLYFSVSSQFLFIYFSFCRHHTHHLHRVPFSLLLITSQSLQNLANIFPRKERANIEGKVVSLARLAWSGESEQHRLNTLETRQLHRNSLRDFLAFVAAFSYTFIYKYIVDVSWLPLAKSRKGSVSFQ